jgi:hypothetical protein
MRCLLLCLFACGSLDLVGTRTDTGHASFVEPPRVVSLHRLPTQKALDAGASVADAGPAAGVGADAGDCWCDAGLKFCRCDVQGQVAICGPENVPEPESCRCRPRNWLHCARSVLTEG